MLEIQALTKYYRNIPVVNDVSFTVRPGEVTGYLGPNGSGKSTTVKMITGLLEPSTGKVVLDGKDIRADLTAFKRRLGYVPEEPHLYSYLTGLEYLQLIQADAFATRGGGGEEGERSVGSAGAASAQACSDFGLLEGHEAAGADCRGAAARSGSAGFG